MVRSSAKSFTAGAQKNHSSKAPVDARKIDRTSEGPSPKDVTYESINQFQQMVELYRGRYSNVRKDPQAKSSEGQ